MRGTKVSVSKRGAVMLSALVDGVWRGIPLEEGEPALLAAELLRAQMRAGGLTVADFEAASRAIAALDGRESRWAHSEASARGASPRTAGLGAT